VDSGGQNVYVGNVARELALAGYQVDLYTRRDSPDQPERQPWVPGVTVVHIPAGPARYVRKEELLPLMDEFAAFVQHDLAVNDGTSLLHANFWLSGLVAANVKRALGIPFVITFHALGRVRRLHQKEADQFPDARFGIEDRIVAEADRLIAECPQDRDDLLNLYQADPSRITIIPCGFDPGELWPVKKEEARAELGLDPSERIVVQIGRMVPRKGIDNAIRGFARLVKGEGIPARMLVVGGESDEPDPALTPEIGRLQRIALEEGVAELVTFVGRRGRDRLRYYYSASDAFVSTPLYEPFGITPLEAMACGTPVIGSRVGGIKFSVVDGVTGYLVPPNDPEVLGRRLADLFRNPDLSRTFGRQGIERVNRLFTWRKVAGAVKTLYGEVLGNSLKWRTEPSFSTKTAR